MFKNVIIINNILFQSFCYCFLWDETPWQLLQIGPWPVFFFLCNLRTSRAVCLESRDSGTFDFSGGGGEGFKKSIFKDRGASGLVVISRDESSLFWRLKEWVSFFFLSIYLVKSAKYECINCSLSLTALPCTQAIEFL